MTGGTVLSSTLAALALFSAAVTGVPGQEAGQQPAPEARFRSSVDVVSVAAVVRDRKGRFVKDLSKQDFEVVDGGQRKPILDFRAESDGPVKLAVLLDVSGSMRVGQRAADARQAANHLFSSLAPGDQAAVFTFDTTLVEAQTFTSDRAALEAAITNADRPYGQTSLYDAIAHTARAAAVASGTGPKGLPQRSAVAVITDGVDTRSDRTPADVARAASAMDVPVYIIAVMAAVDDPRESNHERTVTMASDLRDLAQRTGGELFISSAPAHASIAARQVVSELRHQYVLAFEASSQPGWRPLQVRTRQNSLTVRARTGYTGGAPSSEGAATAAGIRTSQRLAHGAGREGDGGKRQW